MGVGLSRARDLYPATLFLFLIEALDLSTSMLAVIALLAGILRFDGTVALSGLFVVTILWLITQLLRPIIVASALRQGASLLEGGPPLTFTEALLVEAGRGAAFFAYSLYAGALIGTFNLLSIGATLVAWMLVLQSGARLGLTSFAVALALTLAVALGFFGRLWLRLGLVRAVSARQPILPSLYDAVARLAHAPMQPIKVVFLLGALAAVLEAVVGGLFAALPRATDNPFASDAAMLLTLGVPLAAAWMTAAASAFLLHAQWQALLYLELAPEPPPPAEAEETIIPALPLEADAS